LILFPCWKSKAIYSMWDSMTASEIPSDTKE
jgi:hypothetical protein